MDPGQRPPLGRHAGRMQKLITQHITDAVIKQRDDIRRLNNSIEASSGQGHGLQPPDVKSFRDDALSKAGFYAEWRVASSAPMPWPSSRSTRQAGLSRRPGSSDLDAPATSARGDAAALGDR